ncbi:MAG: arsenate reductase (glutaredoxin) [Bacteroidota bacterium]|nr:arsenate reductase (glutaredoxin) [Bacteroidota bacterium]
MKIYHNPRCSKSRQALALLQENGAYPEIIEYINSPISIDELTLLLHMLKIKPIQLVRKAEQIWKENFKGKELSDDEIVNAMAEYPKLIERPIVVKNGKAIIGRPPENVLILLD